MLLFDVNSLKEIIFCQLCILVLLPQNSFICIKVLIALNDSVISAVVYRGEIQAGLSKMPQ